MSKEKKNVAIFPAGSEIGLEINNALKYSTFFKVFGFSSIECHGKYVYSNYISEVPMISDESFIDRFNELLLKYHIDYIYPALDDVQIFLMKNQSKINATVISADLFTVDICRSKEKTYEYFKSEEFIPQTFSSLESIELPVFIKPDIGQGSQGAKLIKTKLELDAELSKNVKYVICEYLPGEEYTIDCFTNSKGELCLMNMRNRKRIRNGISVSSEIINLPNKVKEMAKIINGKLHFFGAWFFQIKLNKFNQYKLLEIAPRIAGTMGITRNKGTNLPLMTLFTFEGMDVSFINNSYLISVDRALMSCYSNNINYKRVYVDLDDTLILNEKVNSYLMMLLFQQKNSGKELILLTKHKNDPLLTLQKYHIDKDLFDEIIWINESDEKYKYIKDSDSIFIDDSFAERKKVNEKCLISVFDCSEVESLVDWRKL